MKKKKFEREKRENLFVWELGKLCIECKRIENL